MICLRIAPELRLFLPAMDRGGEVRVRYDGTASLGHVVQSVGPPLTEVGALRIGGAQVPREHRPRDGDEVEVEPVRRPQSPPTSPPRFLLDVHLGTLARRLRLLGVDAAYRPDADDADLVARSTAEQRVLLTRDRGLLRRRAMWCGAYVYGDRPADQLADVLDRFAPRLAPWTRCTACNGELEPTPKADIERLLEPGTRRSYDRFARCLSCGQLYWRGAHAGRLEQVVVDSERRARRG